MQASNALLKLPERRPQTLQTDNHVSVMHDSQVVTPGLRVSVPSTPEQAEVLPPTAKAGKAGSSATERPEELLPEIISFLKQSPHIRGVAKAVQV